MPSITIAAQIACAQRELKLRRWVYPNQVIAGKKTQGQAAQEIATMEAIIDTLEMVRRTHLDKPWNTIITSKAPDDASL